MAYILSAQRDLAPELSREYWDSVEDLPEAFRSFTTETASNSVILRLFDADRRMIDQRNIPFSSFVAKGR